MRLKVKFYGSKQAVDSFKDHLEHTFLAIVSQTRPTDQGDYHALATIEVEP